jgi:hypothetical protein
MPRYPKNSPCKDSKDNPQQYQPFPIQIHKEAIDAHSSVDTITFSKREATGTTQSANLHTLLHTHTHTHTQTHDERDAQTLPKAPAEKTTLISRQLDDPHIGHDNARERTHARTHKHIHMHTAQKQASNILNSSSGNRQAK